MGKTKRTEEDGKKQVAPVTDVKQDDQPLPAADKSSEGVREKKDKKKSKKAKLEAADSDAKEGNAAPAKEAADGGVAGAADSSNPDGKLLVSEQDAQYLSEVIQHFKTLVDDEERQLLLGNVMEELRGKEAKVAADPICSRHIEKLLAHASSAQLLQFIRACLQEDTLFQLVSG